jgi:hypothetical protein
VIAGIPAGILALGLVLVSAVVIFVVFPQVLSHLGNMVVGSVVLVMVVAILALMIVSVTKTDISPRLRELAVRMTQHRLVDFYTLMPNGYEVTDVLYEDTDSDGQKEWVVFYRFDLGDGRNPYAGVVYDYDRGIPPAIFPYRLTPPDRNYLSEGSVKLTLEDVVNLSEPADSPAKELVIRGIAGGLVTDLTIFRHNRNSFEWDAPSDEQPRYQCIGAFRGNGGVTLDTKNRKVVVINRAHERSQLAVETVYALDELRGTFMSAADPKQLNPPKTQRVAFAFGMPDDLLSTPYPEKLVLGFYEMLGQSSPPIDPRRFLRGQALIEYDRGNLAYFGFLPVEGRVSDLLVSELNYYTEAESVEVLASALGAQPQYLIVSVRFDAWQGTTFVRTPQPVTWVVTWVDGAWRIDRRPVAE